MHNVKMLTKDGVILKTSGKYCDDDITVKPSFSVNEACVRVAPVAVPTSGTVDKIYLNKNLGLEEVNSLINTIENWFQIEEGINVYFIASTSSMNTLLAFQFVGINGIIIAFTTNENVHFIFNSIVENPFELDFYGWNPEVETSFVDFGGAEVVFEVEGISIGTENEKLVSLFSLTPDFEEVIKELSGEYDGAPVAVTQNGKVDISSMLEMKRLPLALEVAVPVPDGYVKPEKEVYTSVNGTLDVTDAAVCTVDVKMINTQPCTFLQLQIPTDNFTLKFKESGFKSWGDGAVDDLITHTYEKAGRYTLVANLAEISHSNTFYQDFENQNVCVTEITVGSAVSEVGIGAFQKCPGLTKVYLRDGITRIGRWAFQLTSLEEVFIPSGVTVIEEYVFADCLNLKRVHIPASVTEIISYAFVRSESIEGFYYGGTVEQWNAITKGQWDSQIGSYTVYCTDGEIVKQ